MKTLFSPLTALRDATWERSTRHLPEACRVPAWAVALRALLYPRSTLHILIRNTHPFDPWTRTWNLYGARFSDRTVMFLAGRMPGNSWYRFSRRGPDAPILIEEVQSSCPSEVARYHAELTILLNAVSRFPQGSPEYRGALVRASRVAGVSTLKLLP